MKSFLKVLNQQLFARIIRIDKQVRMVISTAILSFLMLISTFFFFDKALIFISLFIIFVYFFTYFSLLEGIERIEWFMLFCMPVIFTISCYLFFFLFPVRWLSRLPLILIYTVSIYGILRTSNIFNVGVDKSLQLYRAAFSINYLFQTITLFFLSNFIFSLKLDPISNGGIILIIVFLLSLNILWTIKLDLKLDKLLIRYSLLIAVILVEQTICFSFFNFETSIFALLTAVTYYSLIGLTYAFIDERFFKEVIREYIIILMLVFFICFITLIRW